MVIMLIHTVFCWKETNLQTVEESGSKHQESKGMKIKEKFYVLS